MIRSAMRLNPVYPIWYLTTLARALDQSGRADEANETLKALVVREPGNFFSHLSLASLYARVGRLPEAGKAVTEVPRIDPSYTLAKINRTRIEADRTSGFVDGLRKAGLPE